MSDLAERVEGCRRVLHEAAKAAQMTMSGDQRVSGADAAQLLGISTGGLKLIRQEGRGPTPYMHGVGGGGFSFRLVDLARWIEEGRATA